MAKDEMVETRPKRRGKKEDKRDMAFIAIPAGLFIGMGLGFIYGNFVGFMMLGLGAGFLLGMILRLTLPKQDEDKK